MSRNTRLRAERRRGTFLEPDVQDRKQTVRNDCQTTKRQMLTQDAQPSVAEKTKYNFFGNGAMMSLSPVT